MILCLFVTYGNKSVPLICLFKLQDVFTKQECLYFDISKKEKNNSRNSKNKRFSAKLEQKNYCTLVSKVCLDGMWIRWKLPLLSPTTRNWFSWHVPTTSTSESEKFHGKMSNIKICFLIDIHICNTGIEQYSVLDFFKIVYFD